MLTAKSIEINSNVVAGNVERFKSITDEDPCSDAALEDSLLSCTFQNKSVCVLSS